MNYENEGNPTFFYFHIFGSKYFILNTKDKLSKFDPKSNLDVFLGYSFVSKAYKVYNKKTQTMEETMHITVKEKKKHVDQKVQDLEEEMKNSSLNNDVNNQ